MIPGAPNPALDEAGSWRLPDPAAGPLQVSGRLIGGCLETVSILTGTPYGDLPALAEQRAPEGLVVHLEPSEAGAADAAPAPVPGCGCPAGSRRPPSC